MKNPNLAYVYSFLPSVWQWQSCVRSSTVSMMVDWAQPCLPSCHLQHLMQMHAFALELLATLTKQHIFQHELKNR